MNLRFGLSILIAAIMSVPTSVQASPVCEGFLPKNSKRIPKNKKTFNGMTQEVFDQAIDKVKNVYAPIISRRGATLNMKKLWSDSQVNAVAYRQGQQYVVEIYGGLARHDVMTADGVTLVTCHEVGHHLGGKPKYSDRDGQWASVEGQADYFATMKCLRKVFALEVNSWNGEVDPTARELCEAQHGSGTDDSKICMRIQMASLASARLSQAISQGSEPRLDSKDPAIVSRTYERHPQAQCRLDTYSNGAQCQVPDTVDMSDSDVYAGTCKNTQAENYGARPLCWFKPEGNVQPTPTPTPPRPTPTPTPPRPTPTPTPPRPTPTPTPTPPRPTPTPTPPRPTPTPTPRPNPGDSIAATPMLNGQTELRVSNPNAVIRFDYDVSEFEGAYGVYFEILGPNGSFREPNGLNPDPNAIPGGTLARTRGYVQVIPARHLPGWGVYKFRVIPLDRSGRRPVGRFSNPAVLTLGPN